MTQLAQGGSDKISYTDFPEDVYIFILWSQVGNKKDIVLRIINENFKILDYKSVFWKEEIFLNNLKRFYSTKLEDVEKKTLQIGKGPFEVVIVKDLNPNFGIRETGDGQRFVNTNVWDLKQTLRKDTFRGRWGYRVHSSVTSRETVHDLTLLFGVNYVKKIISVSDSDSITEFNSNLEENRKLWNKNVIGEEGFQSLTELFTVLNLTIDYVVLRSFETLPSKILVTDHEHDIDVLVPSRNDFVSIINGKPVSDDPNSIQYFCEVEGQRVLWDVREPGDNFLPHNFSCDIIKTRVFNGQIYIPSNDNLFWSLIYYCVFHKNMRLDRYIEKCESLIGHTTSPSVGETLDRMFYDFLVFAAINNFSVAKCSDPSVSFHNNFLESESDKNFEEFLTSLQIVLFILHKKLFEKYDKNAYVTFIFLSELVKTNEVIDVSWIFESTDYKNKRFYICNNKSLPINLDHTVLISFSKMELLQHTTEKYLRNHNDIELISISRIEPDKYPVLSVHEIDSLIYFLDNRISCLDLNYFNDFACSDIGYFEVKKLLDNFQKIRPCMVFRNTQGFFILPKSNFVLQHFVRNKKEEPFHKIIYCNQDSLKRKPSFRRINYLLLNSDDSHMKLSQPILCGSTFEKNNPLGITQAHNPSKTFKGETLSHYFRVFSSQGSDLELKILFENYELKLKELVKKNCFDVSFENIVALDPLDLSSYQFIDNEYKIESNLDAIFFHKYGLILLGLNNSDFFIENVSNTENIFNFISKYTKLNISEQDLYKFSLFYSEFLLLVSYDDDMIQNHIANKLLKVMNSELDRTTHTIQNRDQSIAYLSTLNEIENSRAYKLAIKLRQIYKLLRKLV